MSPSPATCRPRRTAPTLVVTSAGIPPTNPLLAAALAAGIEVIGEVELAWRLDLASGAPRDWLVVTGTNGKTTTTGMLESILRAAGRHGHRLRQHRLAGARGGAGRPPTATDDPDEPRQDVIAVELSSFQLHWAPASGRPPAWCSTSPRITWTGTARWPPTRRPRPGR